MYFLSYAEISKVSSYCIIGVFQASLYCINCRNNIWLDDICVSERTSQLYGGWEALLYYLECKDTSLKLAYSFLIVYQREVSF